MENKQKRITLKTVHEMLDGMSVDTERVQKSPSLFKSLTSQRKLLVTRGLYLGMVGNITEI